MHGRWYRWWAAGIVAGGAIVAAAGMTAWPAASTAALGADRPKVSVPMRPATPAISATPVTAPQHATASQRATAQAEQRPSRSDPLPSRNVRPLAITPQREAAALSFAQEHHPELASLLVHLKRNNQREYERAIRELFRTSERLAQAKERDNGRYELEIEIWKVESQIRLLVARLTMNGSEAEMQEKLRSLLVERVDLRIRRQRMERDRLAARLERLEENIAALENERETLVDQSYVKLIESVSKFRRNPPQRRIPAASPAADKPANERPN